MEVSSLIKAVYHDEAFNTEIKGYLEKFYEVATGTIRGYLANENIRAHVLDKIKGNAGDVQLSNDASSADKFNMQSIYFTVLEGVGISVEKREAIQREKRLVAALWVILLECFRNETTINDLKYPILENFLRIYKSYGDNISTIAQESEKEKISLWHTANWMTVLLSMVPARKSKDLAIQVVPKLIEGWDARYITGSGQKRSTAYRVAIFEKEGNVIPRERKKMQRVQLENTTSVSLPSSSSTSFNTHEICDQQSVVPSLPTQPTNQFSLGLQQQSQLQQQYQLLQQLQQFQQLQQMQQMQQMTGTIITGQYPYSASLNQMMGVSGGSDRPLNMNMNMNAAATASGGLDFRSNPELLNFWMNRSGFMPGCPMPNGPNVDNLVNLNRVPMHFNLQAKMNGMYGSGAMPLYGGNYNNSDLASVAALSNCQFGRGWNPNQPQGSVSMSMAGLATSKPTIEPPLQREQSWSGELQAIRSNWEESTGADALGVSSMTSAATLSGLDFLSRATTKMDSESNGSKIGEIMKPKNLVDLTEEYATVNREHRGPSHELSVNDHTDSVGSIFQNPAGGLSKNDEFPRFKMPSILTNSHPTEELSEDSTLSGLSRGNSINLDTDIPKESSAGLTRLNSFSGILRDISWSSQSSNVDASLSEEGGSTANSRRSEIPLDTSTEAVGIPSTTAESRKRKELPGESQHTDQALNSKFKSSKVVSALGPIITRDVTMGLGFNFSKGIPRESSWSNSDLALSQELKEIDSTSSGRSFDILAAVASAISTNDHPNPPSDEHATNKANVPPKKVSIATAADVISSNISIRNYYHDANTSTVQNPRKVTAGAEKDGILGEKRLQSLFGNFK